MSRVAVEEAIAAICRGDVVLIAEDKTREIEGTLVAAADKITPEKIAFMVRYTDGLICLAMEGERLDELSLPLMALERDDSHGTAFTVSIDFADEDSLGYSAADRTHTIRAAVDPNISANQFRRPGHVFPLRYQPGGVLVFPGHAEAAVDLSRLAGLAPSGVLCEVASDVAGEVRDESLSTITIDELISYRWRTEALVERGAETFLPTATADFRAIGYRSRVSESEHIALVLGDVAGKDDVLTRLHSACLTGDVFASMRCDCGAQLGEAMDLIADAGEGVIVYNPTHEGRGTGLMDKLAAYRLQDQGMDTADANTEMGYAVDSRHYGIDAQILLDLKIASVRLLTNNPHKIDQLRSFGVDVSDRVPLWVGENSHNRSYLQTKVARLGHLGDRT